MTIEIVARKMEGGQDHEHIAEVQWQDISTNEIGKSTLATMVAWLDDKTTSNRAIVKDNQGNTSYVGTVHPTDGTAYIRSHADGDWNDNLLALPMYQ